MPGLLEDVKKKVNRPVPELAISEDDTTVTLQPVKPDNGKAPQPSRSIASLSDTIAHFQLDAPMCPNCGHITVRNGACYKCLNCGESLGCS